MESILHRNKESQLNLTRRVQGVVSHFVKRPLHSSRTPPRSCISLGPLLPVPLLVPLIERSRPRQEPIFASEALGPLPLPLCVGGVLPTLVSRRGACDGCPHRLHGNCNHVRKTLDRGAHHGHPAHPRLRSHRGRGSPGIPDLEGSRSRHGRSLALCLLDYLARSLANIYRPLNRVSHHLVYFGLSVVEPRQLQGILFCNGYHSGRMTPVLYLPQCSDAFLRLVELLFLRGNQRRNSSCLGIVTSCFGYVAVFNRF